MIDLVALWKRLSWKQVALIYAGLVAVQVLILGGYAYYVLDSKRVHDAIADGDMGRMKELLDREPALINKRSHYGYTPLLEAARWGRTEAIEELVNRGADVHAMYRTPEYDHEGTALHIAAYFGHTETAAALLRVGADVNALNAAGDTPLDVARSQASGRPRRCCRRLVGSPAHPLFDSGVRPCPSPEGVGG